MPGGGIALLRAKIAVGALTDPNADVRAGISIVLRALEAPIRQIADNAGVEGSIVVGTVSANSSQTYGFNAQTEEYVDMLRAGIVDPAKVVRVALQDAASVAGLLITTEAMVADRPQKDAPTMGGGGGGMGGMGRHGLLIQPPKTLLPPRGRRATIEAPAAIELRCLRSAGGSNRRCSATGENHAGRPRGVDPVARSATRRPAPRSNPEAVARKSPWRRSGRGLLRQVR